jgi:VIT1/CCC1 family predicted Fe2+/Mn2+ transporter
VTFGAFIAFGVLPLLVYLIGIYAIIGPDQSAGSPDGYALWGVCIAVTVVTLFLLGSIAGRYSHQPFWKSGLVVAINGSVAAAIAYFIGWGISAATGVKE